MSSHISKHDYMKSNTIKGTRKMTTGLIIVLIIVFVASFGQILLKSGVSEVGGLKVSEIISTRLFKVLFSPKIFFGIMLYAASMVFWIVALSTMDVSQMYPLISLGYIVTALFSMIFLKENVTLMRWAGIFMIVGGAILVLKS
ncbi:MAG: SMR family transporter [Candidatus Woesearchaeota archaeon]